MKDRQREIFDNLVTEELPSAIKNKSTVVADNLNLDIALQQIDMQNPLTDKDGTIYVPIVAECQLKNPTTTESVIFNLNLLKLPVYQELGFMIRGNYMQMLSSYDKSAGLHTARKVNKSNDSDKAIIQSDNFKSVGFCRDKKKYYVELKLRGGVSDSIKVSPATFFRALTGMSKDELIAKFGYSNNYVVSILDGRPNTFPECKAGFPVATRNDCIQALFAGIVGKKASTDPDMGTIAQKLTSIKRWIFDQNYFDKGAHAAQRVRYMQSFSYRATGKVLAESISSNGIEIAAGTVLSSQLVRELDASELTEITITCNDTNYVLHRFARYWFGALNYTLLEDVPECNLEKGTVLDVAAIDDLNSSSLTSILVKDLAGKERKITRDNDQRNLTVNDLFAVFDIWVNNLNGLEVYDKEFDLPNRVLYPFDKRVCDIVQKNLDDVIYRLRQKHNVKGTAKDLHDYIEAYDKFIDVDEFINDIRSPELKLGQMSEMCNIMSFVSKDYKSTIANLKNIDDNLVTIQDHQYGRTDPFDIPESKKLASVQHETMDARTTDSGAIVTPYLKVMDGKVVSDEPVYLSAIDETDRYIAEWNETFVEADGSPKKYVNARYNGDIVSTDVKNISYKDYSPYVGMSIAHACIPFPGHSDGKRITMGCNQLSQATPMAHPERPYINAGGESLVDYGFYRASTILEDFYKSAVLHKPDLEYAKDAILKSDIQLISKRTKHGSMYLTFSILEMNKTLETLPTPVNAAMYSPTTEQTTYTLTVPYGMQTNDNTLLSYNVNAMPNNIYHPDDIVCYSNSCSLEDKEHLDLMDVGAMKVGKDSLNKGLALTKNLRVGFKTWEGSTIDDSITISDECVFDDILTSIFTTRVVLNAKTYSETEQEKFGILSTATYTYFEPNGLPKVGTYLNAGDPVIAKVFYSENTAKQRFKYLRMNQSGQVIFAGFTMKNNEEVAEVVLAQRAVVEIGDKFAGRCGNKGVVAKIVPAEQMPYDPKTGFRLQMILNPLGVPSRQNISQFLDLDGSECLRQENKISYISPYSPNDLQFVLDMKEVHNVHPSIFIDGRTGKPFERPIHWGTMSMYKLHHMVKKKYHAIGMSSAVDPVFMQPRQSSKLDGGQSFGEMEAWCLMSVNATNILQEIYSYQSTDISTRSEIRCELEHGDPAPYSSDGKNSNGATMLVCYRSLGVDFKTNTDDQTFEFKPLTDDVIHSFSSMPVDSEENLHSPLIFRCDSHKSTKKDQSRDKWGWIDLKMQLIHPNFIYNSRILSLIRVENISSFNKDVAELIMQGILSVETVNQPVKGFTVYKTSKLPETSKYSNLPLDVETTADLTTGIDALVMMFKYMDTQILEVSAEKCCSDWLDRKNVSSASELDPTDVGTYLDRLKWYNFVKEFNANGSLTDYIISAFPVMPQIYRPSFADAKRTEHVDFDWHYSRILNAVAAVERNKNVETTYAVYDRIKSFCGLQTNPQKDEAKHKNIKTYFSGPDSENGDHGKLRTHVQSKRIFCSGRTTIIPAHDTRMKPTEIGVPITMAVKMYESPLIGQLINKSMCPHESISRDHIVKALLLCSKRDKARFIKFWNSNLSDVMPYYGEEAYDKVTQLIYDFVEGRDGYPMQVVLSGRQPSLHKYAIRAYHPKIVLENCINVHTLVCSGYNADFDGDQMWIQALISDASKEEGLRLFSPAVDYINPKDSSLILKHTQDVVLGLYCMSMLKDNATHVNVTASDIHFYQSVEQLTSDLKADLIKTYDIVCVNVADRRYLSTAGRIVLNSITSGFTEEPFTNPLCIPGIKNELYNELKYDGIWGSGGNVKTGNFRYFKIADICMDMNDKIGSECLDTMQTLTELGFYYADKFGISLSLEDMMLKPVDKSETLTDPKLIDLNDKELTEICNDGLKEASSLKVEIEQDCYDGLISEDDKNDAIMTLYYSGTGDKDSPYEKGVHTEVMGTIMDKLSKTQRNNNIFILLDSGARGKADQIMRMCGFLPQLQKDKMNSLKTPVTHNFLHGLSSFDVHMTSYSVKQGLASTQNETPQAGYATHKGVYMTSGVQIVENDCGKTDWWFDVHYTDLNDRKTMLVPTKIWFTENLLGKVVAASDLDTLQMLGLSEDNREITEDCFTKILVANGFHSIQLDDGTIIEASISMLPGVKLVKADKLNYTKLAHTLKNGTLTSHSISLIQKLTLPGVTTINGTYVFWYKINPCDKSMLLHRQCRDLPFTKQVYDPESMEDIEVTTEKTVAYIEEKNLRTVPVRILLDCKSEHGICAHCYGLKFSSLKFPKIGDFVGTESAQAIGEPSAQLTISLVNQGGTAGAAINDGVARFSGLLDGSVTDCAVVAPRSGYVQIEQLGNVATVCIKPAHQDCELCNGCAVDGKCPVQLDNSLPACAIKNTIDSQLLVCKDGDWVDASQPLTSLIISPKTINVVPLSTSNKDVLDTKQFKYVYRRKQMVWLENYFETFANKGIDINARHFEILARIQNLQGFVYSSSDPAFKEGQCYEITSLMKAGSSVKFAPRLSPRAEVIMNTSGAMAALSFERIQSVAARLCVDSYKSPYRYNNSLLGSVAVGTDLVSGKPPKFGGKKAAPIKRKPKQVIEAPITYKTIETSTLEDSDDLLAGFDLTPESLSDLASSLQSSEAETDTSNNTDPQKISFDDEASAQQTVDDSIDAYMPSDFDSDELSDIDVKESNTDTVHKISLTDEDSDNTAKSTDVDETSDVLDDLDSIDDLDEFDQDSFDAETSDDIGAENVEPEDSEEQDIMNSSANDAPARMEF